MIPYRAKRALRNLLITVLVLALTAAAVLLCWVLWLNRYVVYTQDGAKLDFDLSLEYPEGSAPEDPATTPTVDIIFNENSSKPQVSTELARFSGYTVTIEELAADFDGVSQLLLQLPEGSTIALQVKDLEGYFCYSSTLGRLRSDIDSKKMDQLIAQLKEKGYYLIARVPAFQDKYYFLDDERGRVPYGLPKDGGDGSLWYDKSLSCYWFNPASDGCLSFLIQVISELRQQGFQEVLLDDFRFPRTSMIRFDGDQQKALDNAAATLVKACTTETFTLSFGCLQLGLALPEGRCRLFVSDVVAAEAAQIAAQSGIADAAIRVGFLTELHDTRFDAYCVIRPLSAAQE